MLFRYYLVNVTNYTLFNDTNRKNIFWKCGKDLIGWCRSTSKMIVDTLFGENMEE